MARSLILAFALFSSSGFAICPQLLERYLDNQVKISIEGSFKIKKRRHARDDDRNPRHIYEITKQGQKNLEVHVIEHVYAPTFEVFLTQFAGTFPRVKTPKTRLATPQEAGLILVESKDFRARTAFERIESILENGKVVLYEWPDALVCGKQYIQKLPAAFEFKKDLYIALWDNSSAHTDMDHVKKNLEDAFELLTETDQKDVMMDFAPFMGKEAKKLTTQEFIQFMFNIARRNLEDPTVINVIRGDFKSHRPDLLLDLEHAWVTRIILGSNNFQNTDWFVQTNPEGAQSVVSAKFHFKAPTSFGNSPIPKEGLHGLYGFESEIYIGTALDAAIEDLSPAYIEFVEDLTMQTLRELAQLSGEKVPEIYLENILKRAGYIANRYWKLNPALVPR